MARPKNTPDTKPRRQAERRQLTDRFVRSVRPNPAERLTFYDSLEPGLALRVYPSGARAWKFAYRVAGRPRWYTIEPFCALAVAREAVRRLKARLVLEPGCDPQAEKLGQRRAGTFRELAERYLAHAERTQKSWRQYEAPLRKLALPRWGTRPAGSLERSDVRQLIRERERASPSSAALLLAALSACFKWALAEELVDLPANPAHGIHVAKGASRERVLAEDELPRLWAALADLPDQRAAAALKLVLLTGQRPGEVRCLRWQDVEAGEHAFDRVTRDGRVRRETHAGAWWNLPGEPTADGTWPGTKNGQSHRVWLTPAALELLGEPRAGGYAFPGRRRGQPVAKLDGPMRKVCEELKLAAPRPTPHDLRRTHGTTVTSLGLTRDAMNRVQNHREGGIGSVYDRHEYLDEARRVQEAAGGRLLQLATGVQKLHTAAGEVVELAARRAR